MKSFRIALAAVLFAGPALAQQAAPEPVTLDAFSVWSGSGSVVATGPAAHAFAGVMQGPYFIDVGKGPIPAGDITCLGILEADMETGAQTGVGRCNLRAADGAVAYGRFECAGYRLVGCSGTFELTGGESRMAGATGSGPIVIRRYETTLAVGDGTLAEAALGIAFWKGFTVTLGEGAAQ